LEQIIVLEAKCFTKPESDLDEFYSPVGQYMFYRNALRLEGKPYPIFLAIPYLAHERFKLEPVFEATLQDARVKLVIVDIETEEVVQWLR
jgi:XisH protein